MFGVLPAATIGTVVSVVGGAGDLVLDSNRNLLYLVRSVPYNRIDVYSTTQRRVTASIPTDANPLAAALSPDGNFLYVTCHDASSINVIDARQAPPAVVRKVSLPARPEGVAVGRDGKVLVTTIGSGTGNLLNTMLIYDPSVTNGEVLSTVPVAPPPPLPPSLPAPSGRTFLANRSQLVASRDGSLIVGVNAYQQQNRVVFVYETASNTVQKSRIVGDLSTVISVSPDGSRFMLGLRLFDTDTLAVVAQQNAANAPFPLSTNITATGFAQVGQQFNLQQNQGGSIFSNDGGTIYSAFNIAPIQSPAARANVTQLLQSDSDNLLIQDGLQLPENLAGKMVLSADGSTIYGLSESGFTIIPLLDAARSPLLQPSSGVVLLASDQCASIPNGARARVDVVNESRVQTPVTVTATLVQSLGGVTVPGLGVGGGGVVVGPGGGAPGGGVIIVTPTQPLPGVGTTPGLTNQQQVTQQTAPSVRVVRDGASSYFDIGYNTVNSRGMGTPAAHDFLVTSQQAVNLPSSVRVFQNSRSTEARGDLIPIRTGISPNEALTDLTMDSSRGRVYIANSGMNRVEVFDTRGKRLLTPIKVGQLPRSLAMSPDGSTLYVANSGGESISVIDLDRLEVRSKIKFPAIPFNGSAPVISPTNIAVTQSGLQILMSNGTLWRVIGDEATPRPVSPVIGTATIPAPRTMAATPNGEYLLLLSGTGNAYLYDALVDDFVAARQVASAPIQGFYGPVSAGPRGQYFLVNNTVLNQSLSPVSAGATGTGSRPVAAVFAASATNFVRFSQPVISNANAVVTDTPAVEIVNAATGTTTRSVNALEGPASTVTGTTRVNIDGRLLAVDAAVENAYMLTASGLSILPLAAVPTAERPQAPAAGVVNVGNYTTATAQNGLISIFGQNLGTLASAQATPLPTTLGGTCVTINNVPAPLLLTSAGQINAQVPPELATGRYSMVVRSIDKRLSSQAVQVTVAKYAPAVLTDPQTQRALVFRPNGEAVGGQRWAKRDEPLVLYAVGLGNPKGGVRLTAGTPAPSDKLAETDDLQLYFKKVVTEADKTRGFWTEEEMIVDWSGLVPGYVGLYQVNFRVPGAHRNGENLQVVLKIGGVMSSLTGPVVPLINVE
ncbi:MAG TPA: hypothetical protein VFQ91_19355 [Bryobacteraceae bacterium]|nr:hypothetical protein [Bryobacteraceae bacterium]